MTPEGLVAANGLHCLDRGLHLPIGEVADLDEGRALAVLGELWLAPR